MKIYTVRQGDTLDAVARREGTTAARLIHDNQLAYPSRLVIGQALVITQEDTLYTVRSGDSLYAIAARHGTNVNAILQANPSITNPSMIFPGQVIRIPGSPRPSGEIQANGYCYPTIARDTLIETLPYFTHVLPFSYNIRRDGSLASLNDAPVLSALPNTGVTPLMVIANIDENYEFSSALAHDVLQSRAVQERLLDHIVPIMQSKGYVGLDVDFEYVLGEDRLAYNGFLERCALRLRPLGYTLSTAVPAKEYAGQTGTLFDGIDYAAHGRIADRVLIMTYDWGYLYGPPMAVAPLNLVERAIQYAISQIPNQKVLMGIPNYGYDWTLPYQQGRPARLVSNVGAVSLAATHWAQIQFDPVAMAPFFNYWDAAGSQHVVWFDDARSIEAKLGLVAKYNLGGIGYWNMNTLFRQALIVLTSTYRIRKA